MVDKLAEDAAAALVAGMSYGKYIAMSYKQKTPIARRPILKKEKPRGSKACIICGSQFEPRVHNQICCGYKCSAENNRIKANKRAREIYAERKQN